VDYPVPSNDDATKSIAIITSFITAAIAEGLAERASEKEEVVEEDDGTDKKVRKFEMETDEERASRNRSKGPSAPPRRRTTTAGFGGRRPPHKR